MIIEELLTFSNQSNQLTGTLYKPGSVSTTPLPVVIVLHAANGGIRTYPFYTHLKTVLPELGIAVFIYDRRGAGESSGSFELASFDVLADDAIACIEMLKKRKDLDSSKNRFVWYKPGRLACSFGSCKIV